jgi:cytochrome-b5 reductase
VEDILLREELESFAANYKDNFKLYFTVDVKPEDSLNWKYGVGFVTQDMIKKHLPAPSAETIILYCGPPPFEEMMKKHLTELGYSDDMVFKF